MSRDSSDSDGEAHALRRYVASRAHGRPHPEFSRYDSTIACWVASDEAEAVGRCDGKRFRQVRRPGLPWCRWLGPETVIAEDHALQAFFELHASEQHDWNRLLKEVSRARHRALRDWHRRGREILHRIRIQETCDPEIQMPAGLAEEFRMPGRGMRSLRKA
ncbi:hypothetical protein LB543_01180 [Mesorhizobium sp. ESP7-2]|uniref:hypothetical protein n=1 Tax=Mesorhizobium sp. ESP7-2 TaxID=2876622 RepID=UPI001CCF8AAD|nr:hypothetical protein [Mesorhizobium sp. ESP7-2]MBZ9705341.1 hypothetical protein [Mesorhizobium sp. ESP7-2]